MLSKGPEGFSVVFHRQSSQMSVICDLITPLWILRIDHHNSMSKYDLNISTVSIWHSHYVELCLEVGSILHSKQAE